MKPTLKLVLILVIIYLSEISSKSQLKKISAFISKNKAKTKNDSWETGFTCPRIRIRRYVNEIGSKKTNSQVLEDIRIMGPHILTPRDDIDKSGMAFEFRPSQKPFGDFEDVFVKHPNPAFENTYILPYMKVYRDFYFTLRGAKKIWFFGGGRHVVLYGYALGQKIRENGGYHRYRIKITLPYEGNHTKVTDSEISKIIYGINFNRVDIHERLNENKLGTLKSLNAYKRDREILQDYIKSNGDFQAFRKKYKEKLLGVTKKFYTRAIASAIYLAQMITLKEDRGQLSAKIFQLSNKVDNERRQLEEVALEQESTKGSADSQVKMQAHYTEKKDELRRTLVKLITDLNQLDPSFLTYSNNFIENMKNNPITSTDQREFVRKLNELIPC